MRDMVCPPLQTQLCLSYTLYIKYQMPIFFIVCHGLGGNRHSVTDAHIFSGRPVVKSIWIIFIAKKTSLYTYNGNRGDRGSH